MKPHCTNCLSECREDIDTGRDPEFQGYTRCCNDRVCDGTPYDVRIGPTGQEVMGWERDEPAGTRRIRTCCVVVARELLGIR